MINISFSIFTLVSLLAIQITILGQSKARVVVASQQQMGLLLRRNEV